MLDLPAAREGDESYLRVHPDFTAIFTSNPEEYAGVYRSQDALRDRMITMDLNHFNRETEIGIVETKTGLSPAESAKIVELIRGLRESGKCEYAPTIRGPMMIGKTLQVRGANVSKDNAIFRETALEILSSETSRVGSKTHQKKVKDVINKLIDAHC